MQKLLLTIAFFSFAALVPQATATESAPPTIPNTANTTAVQPATFPVAPPVRTRADAAPVRVSIPSIKLNAPIQNMGVLGSGELDVPDGNTNNVGWYAAGTVPGEQGSAVFDAHVFAAFAKLKNLKVGADIYVTAADGQTLHFKVEESKTYPLAKTSAEALFNRADQTRLNLITCAGNLTADHSTYDHRLVVYAVLVS